MAGDGFPLATRHSALAPEISFGVQGAVAEAVDAGEDGLLPLVAGFDAGALQVVEDEILKRGQPAVLLPLPGQFLWGDGFVALERLHGEGASHAQALLVRLRLIVEGFLLGGLVIGYAAQGDVRDFFVVESLAHLTGFLIVQQIVGKGGRHQPGLGDVQRDADGIRGDPTPPPLLRHIRRGPASGARAAPSSLPCLIQTVDYAYFFASCGLATLHHPIPPDF